jgi:hypothetical protein
MSDRAQQMLLQVMLHCQGYSDPLQDRIAVIPRVPNLLVCFEEVHTGKACCPVSHHH